MLMLASPFPRWYIEIFLKNYEYKIYYITVPHGSLAIKIPHYNFFSIKLSFASSLIKIKDIISNIYINNPTVFFVIKGELWNGIFFFIFINAVSKHYFYPIILVYFMSSV